MSTRRGLQSCMARFGFRFCLLKPFSGLGFCFWKPDSGTVTLTEFMLLYLFYCTPLYRSRLSREGAAKHATGRPRQKSTIIRNYAPGMDSPNNNNTNTNNTNNNSNTSNTNNNITNHTYNNYNKKSTSCLIATTFIHAIGAGITAAAGTRLALQSILVKGVEHILIPIARHGCPVFGWLQRP